MAKHFSTYSYEEYMDYGFNIYTDLSDEKEGTAGAVSNCPAGYLYIETDLATGRIVRMNCEVRRTMIAPFCFPDIRNRDDLEPFHGAFLYGSFQKDDYHGFLLNLQSREKELDIVIEPQITTHYYYKEGRVEYYYSDDWELLYIKVVDLTDDEYTFLKGFC